jgi:hypothetical protein
MDPPLSTFRNRSGTPFLLSRNQNPFPASLNRIPFPSMIRRKPSSLGYINSPYHLAFGDRYGATGKRRALKTNQVEGGTGSLWPPLGMKNQQPIVVTAIKSQTRTHLMKD